MSLMSTCSSCGSRQSVDAGFVGDDAKRLGGVLAEMQPALGRAALSYMRLFKPAKTDLRLARAVKLLQDLAALVAAGTVTKDDRSGTPRPATHALWATGIEQLLVTSTLELPLENHNYLRKVVYGLADKADAGAEKQREADLRSGSPRIAVAGVSPIAAPENPLRNALAYLSQQLDYGQISQEEFDALADEARAKHGDSA